MSLGNAHDYVQDTTIDPRPLVCYLQNIFYAVVHAIVIQIVDIAHGLFYLHNHTLGPIIHGDLKGVGLFPLSTYTISQNNPSNR